MSLKSLDKNIKKLIIYYLITLGVGFSLGIVYVYLNSEFSYPGMIEQYLGNEEQEEMRWDDPTYEYKTAKTLKDDVLKGYKVGADDYLTKPFDSEILLAKIKSLFSRKSLLKSNDSNVYEFNFSEFNFNSKLRMLIHKNNDPIKLSPKENELLKMLVLNINDLLPRDIALNKIWRDDNYFTSRSMDVYIAKLRKYLEIDKKIKIINIHGEGFRLTVDK